MIWKLIQFTALSTVILGSSMVLIPEAEAQSRPQAKFYCGTFQGEPATFARSSRGDIPVFVWTSSDFENQQSPNVDYTPQKRCDLVSRKFDQFYNQKRLDFLTTAQFGGLETVCVSQQKGKPCNRADVLFTLEPSRVRDEGITAQGELQKLLVFRASAGSTGPIERNGQIWLDLKDFLRYAPIASEADLQTPQTQSSPPLF